MGAWNIGNFDNDTASDLICEQRETWIKKINKAVKYYQRPGVTPMEAEDEIMAYLEMIYRIAAHRSHTTENSIEMILLPSILPERKDLEFWRTVILSKHIEYFGEVARTSGRFDAISTTFQELIALSR